MNAATIAIIEGCIEDQAQAMEGQRLTKFLRGVEGRAERQVAELQAVYGEALGGIAGEVMQGVQGYRETQLRLYDPDFKVKDTGRKGAAAWNEKGGDNSIAIGYEGIALVKDERYWGLVSRHELVHQQEQAAVFNLSGVTYSGETVEVNPVLVEWHAITVSNQPDTDLTPDYISHRQRGDALVAFLGSREPLLRALKTGDMQTLQHLIDEKLQKLAA